MENFINKIIQYEENIFYLKMMLNNIKKSHYLNINNELFNLKIKNDLLFIDKTNKILFEHLVKNDKLITKDEHLHSILELKRQFLSECTTLIKKGLIRDEDFSLLMLNNKKDIEIISGLLFSTQKDLNREDLTTNEELNILFMDENLQEKELSSD